MAKAQTIAVAGNPNCGKTTLFNGLTGSNQRIGNWPGVTVEKKEGRLSLPGVKESITLVDLPGIYSLAVQSEDERVARDYILSGEPGLVVNILDATNLERNLYLTTQLMEMGVPVLAVINMMDLAAEQGTEIDLAGLEARIGCPVVGISATRKKDMHRVKEAIAKAWREKNVPRRLTEFPGEAEALLKVWQPRLRAVAKSLGATERWVGLKLLEQDGWVRSHVVAAGSLTEAEIQAELAKVEAKLGESSDIVLADARYRFIHQSTEGLIRRGAPKESASDRIDRVVMHRWLGIPIFLVVMYLVFWATVNVGGAFIDFFDGLFGTVFVDGFGKVLEAVGTPQWLISILAGGVGAGVQTVATFIPPIFALFLALSLLEDSGYMARAAFVMDRAMRWLGLPGKSFVTMLVGFGCSVPAVLATRTLENKRDRYLTIFMTPLMSCGARLPVYALFGAAFFGASAGNMVFSLYLIGILLAVLSGLMLKRTLFKGEAARFVMELPPYHAPQWKNIMKYSGSRLWVFMSRARVIIPIVTLLAFLNSFGVDGTFGNENTQKSVLSQIGKGITPIFEPMGVEKNNWPATVGIFTGVLAKEAVVGTLNALYSQNDVAGAAASADSGGVKEEKFDFWGGIKDAFKTIPDNLSGVWASLRDPLGLGIVSSDQKAVAEEVGADQQVYKTMQNYFTHGALQAYAYLLFILIYFPCVAALGAIIRELGSGYGMLAMTYLTVLAWIIATLFYQITIGRQLVWIIVPLAMLAAIVICFNWLGKRNADTLNGSLGKPKQLPV